MKTVNCINWKNRFFKEVPMVDENGKPIPWNPPLNSGFFLKKKDTAITLKEHIELVKEEYNKRRRW